MNIDDSKENIFHPIIYSKLPKYFKIRTSLLQIYENFEEGFIDTFKRHNLR